MKPRKRYRVTIWRKVDTGQQGPADTWHHIATKEYTEAEARLLINLAGNLGLRDDYWCHYMRPVNGRMVAVERIP